MTDYVAAERFAIGLVRDYFFGGVNVESTEEHLAVFEERYGPGAAFAVILSLGRLATELLVEAKGSQEAAGVFLDGLERDALPEEYRRGEDGRT